jgi:hypothetical protein
MRELNARSGGGMHAALFPRRAKAQIGTAPHRPEARMTSDSPVHDFLLPRLTALINETVATGTTREIAVAVMIDLITSPRFDTAMPDPEADSAPHADWDRAPDSPLLVGGRIPIGARPIGAQDEADFIRPFDGLRN